MIHYPDTLVRQKGSAWPGSVNEYGEASGAQDTIQARVEPFTNRVLAANGEEHQSQFKVFTPDDVRVGDVLTIEGVTQIVKTSAPMPDLSGTVWHREVVC